MATDLSSMPDPTDDDLHAIEAEMALIRARMDLDWIEIHLATTPRELTDLDARRWRKAAARVSAEARVFYDRPARRIARVA